MFTTELEKCLMEGLEKMQKMILETKKIQIKYIKKQADILKQHEMKIQELSAFFDSLDILLKRLSKSLEERRERAMNLPFLKEE